MIKEQIEAATRVLRSGNLSSLHGKEVETFEKNLGNKIGSEYTVAVNSGTAALHLALLALKFNPGDEIIVPATTFLSTAAAVLMVGAKPVFADIEKGFYNLDPRDFYDKITDKTKAVIPVHIAGIPCKMDLINKIAHDHDMLVIEDACQALGAKYKNKYVGTWGTVGVFSFYPSKIITTGEGGVIVCKHEIIAARIKKLRNHGREGGSYGATVLGYNYRMTEIAGALGNVGLTYLNRLVKEYQKLANDVFLIAIGKGEETPKVPYGSEIAPTYIPLKARTPLDVKDFLPPLYRTKLFQQNIILPNAEDAWRRTYTIPLQDLKNGYKI